MFEVFDVFDVFAVLSTLLSVLDGSVVAESVFPWLSSFLSSSVVPGVVLFSSLALTSTVTEGPFPVQLVGAAIPASVDADLHHVSPASTLNV